MNYKEELFRWFKTINHRQFWIPFIFIVMGIGLASLSIILFSELAENVLAKETFTFDQAIIDFVHTFDSNFVQQAMPVITEAGSVWWLTMLVILTIAYLVIKKRAGWTIFFFILTVGGGGLLTRLLKHFFARSRPTINPQYDAVGFSFPSGHAMGSFLFYGFIGYLVARECKRLAVKVFAIGFLSLFILMIGISRIYLGAHYPSDVLAGYAAGTIWLVFCVLALEIVLVYQKFNYNAGKLVRKILYYVRS
ncbi:phosphatase PAP2 family protein [Pseudalkalibacillus caeni]|uniref:Phosphatase PAP2 family protein n=1 Tax=Exobacillus caeni TaxID=2574798 RepID=A0A5R9F1V5_9BACL|nr:phosphatase PAP2 family protein [Pseudalkalibacillus caeni]TLS37021.1 phosphatase PAP2 family protein [Pseudalkalibacillus caeni]